MPNRRKGLHRGQEKGKDILGKRHSSSGADDGQELIKVRGWQVAPAELEGILLTHPAVCDAAVIGIQKVDADSETPRAYVVRKPGTTITGERVKTFLLANLAKYKVLDCEIRFRNDIPKSPSGKILRKILRDEASKEVMVEERHFTEAPSKSRLSGDWYSITNGRDAALLSILFLGTVALCLREVSRFVQPHRALLR